MFCNQCGLTNSINAKFCSNCGTGLEAPNHQNTIIGQPSTQIQTKQIELWNPTAAANWSLLFSPAFGAYIHMKNWKALGDYQKAKSSKIWFIASIILSILGLGFIVLIAWYLSIGKKQITYVKQEFGENYVKKSWGTPLLIGFSFFIVFVIFFMIVPENQNNHPQQATSQSNQENTQNQTQSQSELEQTHINAILSAHPDAKSVIQSQDFNNWVNNQPTTWKNYYNQVLDKGNSSQVIDMLNDYKNGINH